MGKTIVLICVLLASLATTSVRAQDSYNTWLVKHIYHFVYNRDATSAEVNYYRAKLDARQTSGDSLRRYLASSEEAALHINYRYERFFDRKPDSRELAIWRENLSDPSERYGLNALQDIMLTGGVFEALVQDAYADIMGHSIWSRDAKVSRDELLEYATKFVLSPSGNLANLKKSGLRYFLGVGCKMTKRAGICDGSALPTDRSWKLVVSDEFEGPVNEEKWEIFTGNNHPAAVRSYDKKENVVVSKGILKLKTTRNPQNGAYYTAGMRTRTKYYQGYFEARIKSNPHRGNDDAFWLMTQEPEDSKKHKFEIDGAEFFAPGLQLMNIYNHTNHWADKQFTHYSDNISTGFHIYGIRWDSWGVRWYKDNQQIQAAECRYCDNGANVYLTSHTIKFKPWGYETAADSKLGGKGSDMQIDWVRIYK